MRTFKWNGPKESARRFWNYDDEEWKAFNVLSDKDIVKNPNCLDKDQVLIAICRVISELVEIEESRNKT